MKCESCGSEGFGRFCENCGAPLPASAQVTTNSEVDAAAVVPPVYDHAPGMGSSQEEIPVYDAEPVSGQTTPTVNPGNSSEGILGQAWRDVSKDPSFVKKSLLLGLVNCVPILNFVCTGYSLRWGRRAAFRSGDQLPEKIFGDKAFETGFFAFVLMLVWGLVVGIVSIVPLVGWIVPILAVPFMILAVMLMVLMDELGAGFRIKDLWEAGKRNFGGLMLISYVPTLVVVVVVVAISLVFSIAFGLNIAALALGDSLTGDISIAAVAFSGIIWIVLGIVLAVFLSVVSVVANLVIYRAFGYWIGRMAPDWVQESISKGVGV